MERLKDFTQFTWIKEETEPVDHKNWKGCYISNLIPHRYKHFCKIMHPIYRDLNVQDETLLWSQCDFNDSTPFHFGERLTLRELAQKYNLQYTKEIRTSTIFHLLGGYPRYLLLPDEGNMDKETLYEILSVLQPFTRGKKCYFHFSTLKTVHTFKELSRGGHLYHGKLNEVMELYEFGDFSRPLGSPSYSWSEDKSWCVHTDFDCDFSIIGGSKELIGALLTNKNLECIEVDRDTRIDSKGDKLNQP